MIYLVKILMIFSKLLWKMTRNATAIEENIQHNLSIWRNASKFFRTYLGTSNAISFKKNGASIEKKKN